MIFFKQNGRDDMVRRFLFRGMAIVPLSLSVLFLSIWMFYKLPGVNNLDTVHFEWGSEREIQQLFRSFYRSNQPRSGQGMFYFGVLGNEVPKNYYELPAPFQPAFLELCKEVKNADVMKEYGAWMIQVIQNPRGGIEMQNMDYQRMVDLFRSSQLTEVIRYSRRMGADELDHIIKKMEEKSGESRDGYRWVWLGKNNLFHYYLSGIFSWKNDLRTKEGIPVKQKVVQVFPWTLAYTLPVLPIVVVGMYWLVLLFYENRWLMKSMDKVFMLTYAFPVFVIATTALIFFTSNRYGQISRIFPFPVFMSDGGEGLRSIYVRYLNALVLPMLLFGLRPMILFFRAFREKINEVVTMTPVPEYLVHIGMASRRFRISYLGRYLMVTIWSVLPGMFLAALSGSLMIEYIFNIPGLGRFYFDSVVEYDVASSVFLIFGFTVIQQLGHLISDVLIDYYLSSQSGRTKLT